MTMLGNTKLPVTPPIVRPLLMSPGLKFAYRTGAAAVATQPTSPFVVQSAGPEQFFDPVVKPPVVL